MILAPLDATVFHPSFDLVKLWPIFKQKILSVMLNWAIFITWFLQSYFKIPFQETLIDLVYVLYLTIICELYEPFSTYKSILVQFWNIDRLNFYFWIG